MIIYEEPISMFINDCVDPNIIAEKITHNLITRIGEYPDEGLIQSFKKSLPLMANVLNCDLFCKEINVAIEYTLATKSRADFIIYGKDEFDHDNVVVVELKQWATAKSSNKQDYVFTNGGDGLKDYWHPSIQAYNYVHLLRLFNEYVRDNNIILNACSFMHNMDNAYSFILQNENVFPLVTKVPAFLKDDAEALKDFLHRHVCKPYKHLLYYIDDGKISPSPELASMLENALKGNPFFSYDANQSESVATIVEKAQEAINEDKRATIIIKGGPGTGKSVVAINALGQIVAHTKPTTNRHNNAVYVTQNKAPRSSYKTVLKDGDFTLKDIGNFFKSPTIFNSCPEKEYDCVLIDEAHRLYNYKFDRFNPMKAGSNMLDLVIKSSKVNVFFIDEDQAVTTSDYATIDHIKEFAKKYKSEVIEGKELTLTSQYRCIGGGNYVNWVKSILGYEGKVPFIGEFKDYKVEVFDSPQKMREEITKLNDIYGKCRILAGYTHDWVSLRSFKKTGQKFENTPYDFIYKDGFKMRWNKGMDMADKDYSYLDDVESINQIGCIHTIQGLDLPYAGVIIGKDMIYRNGNVIFDKSANVDSGSAKIDKAPDDIAEKLIRNTYNVLLTRGMRGTFIYCEDEELRNYIREHLKNK